MSEELEPRSNAFYSTFYHICDTLDSPGAPFPRAYRDCKKCGAIYRKTADNHGFCPCCWTRAYLMRSVPK